MNRLTMLRALLVSAGRIGFVALWFGAVMLVYAGLASQPDGLAQAGVFALAIACIKVASGCISDPIDLAIMRGLPASLAAVSDGVMPGEALAVLRAAFALRLLAVLAVALPVAALAPAIAAWVAPGYPAVVRWVALAIVGEALFRAMLVAQQARERFVAFVLLEGLLQVGRTGAIAVLWVRSAMRVDTVLACYAAVSLTAACAGALMLPGGLGEAVGARSVDALRRHAGGLLRYVRWMLPAMMMAALNERLDVIMVYALLGSGAAGLYGGVLTVALVPDILGGCLSAVLQPRIVRMHGRGEVMAEFRRYLTLAVPLCAAGLAAAWLLAGTVLPLVLGARYAPAVPAFLWLLAGTLFWLAVTPLPGTLVAVLAPGRTLVVTALQTATVLATGLLLLPLFGPVGMAQGVLVTRVVVALALCVMARAMTRDASGRSADDVPGAAATLRAELPGAA